MLRCQQVKGYLMCNKGGCLIQSIDSFDNGFKPKRPIIMCEFTWELFQVSILSHFFHIITLLVPLSHSLVARRRKSKNNCPYQDLNRRAFHPTPISWLNPYCCAPPVMFGKLSRNTALEGKENKRWLQTSIDNAWSNQNFLYYSTSRMLQHTYEAYETSSHTENFY